MTCVRMLAKVCTVDTEKCEFAVMLIAHTQKCIILPHKEEGGKVNIEVDVISKYVEEKEKKKSVRQSVLLEPHFRLWGGRISIAVSFRW